MAKYGKILNVYVYADSGVITTEQGEFITKVYSNIFPSNMEIDLETGVIINFKCLTKDQIVELIEESDNKNA